MYKLKVKEKNVSEECRMHSANDLKKREKI